MTVKQAVFVVVAEVPAGALAEVRATVATLRTDPAHNQLLAFADHDRIHFASVILADHSGVDPALVILEVNGDGTARECLTSLVEGSRKGLEALFGASPGWPGTGGTKETVAWFEQHIVRPGAYHIGATGRTHERIRQEQRLHEAISAFLDGEEAAGRLVDVPADEVRRRIQDFVRADPSLAWARTSPPRQTKRERMGHRARLYGALAGAVILAIPLLPIVLVGVVALRVMERRDKVLAGPPDPEYVRRMAEEEDFYAQNHLSSVIPIKAGAFRRVLLRTVLAAINLVARVSAVNGKLGDIPSIHFAHWSMVNNHRHLLFVSNFDGSWESYLGDFIDKAAKGLTAVWSNTVDFPRTRFVAFDGAADGPRFRHWARAKQCSTDVWYTAYPAATMGIIDNNTAIREGLFTALDEKATATWLARL